jgi:HD-like signal output (HDOD) protein/ActR/RegA family two-component response regulator
MTINGSATRTATPGGKKHILFVDDEPQVLDGLRDALRPRRREWRMTFADGGQAALAALEREPVDIVVSDLRMPGMDGATLLAEVAQLQPDAVRIVLSGQADAATLARVAAVAHRILVKPCPIDDVTRVIERACVLLDVTAEVTRAAGGACTLPSAPETYRELMAVLGCSDATTAQIATVVEHDIAMSAQVLHLANAAYFGLDKPVLNVEEAVALLGQDMIKAIVLTADAFHTFDVPASIPGFSLEHVQHRSLQVGRLARMLSQDDPASGDAFAAGLLLDVGLLVLAAHAPEYLADVLLTAEREGRPVHEIEFERKGITHAEIGAHLFALWGLPHAIVEAVAHHHRPSRSPLPAFDTVAIAHIADALLADAEAGSPDGASTLSRIDSTYVECIGMTGRIAEWQQLATAELAAPQA